MVTAQPIQTAPITQLPPLLNNEGYALQIAAYRKADQLVEGWNILHKRYADLIGTLSPRRSEVDFGKRNKDPKGFFYRLNAGPLTTFEEAKVLCDQIISRGGPCWVRSPEPAEGHLPKEQPKPENFRSVSAEPATTTPAAPQQTSANEPKAHIDVEALVNDKPTPPQQSASTRWEQVGDPNDQASQQPNAENEDGAAQGNAGDTPEEVPTPEDVENQ